MNHCVDFNFTGRYSDNAGGSNILCQVFAESSEGVYLSKTFNNHSTLEPLVCKLQSMFVYYIDPQRALNCSFFFAFLFIFLGDGMWHHNSPEHGKLNGQEKEFTCSCMHSFVCNL